MYSNTQPTSNVTREITELLQKHPNGLTTPEIMNMLGRSHASVYSWIKQTSSKIPGITYKNARLFYHKRVVPCSKKPVNPNYTHGFTTNILSMLATKPNGMSPKEIAISLGKPLSKIQSWGNKTSKTTPGLQYSVRLITYNPAEPQLQPTNNSDFYETRSSRKKELSCMDLAKMHAMRALENKSWDEIGAMVGVSGPTAQRMVKELDILPDTKIHAGGTIDSKIRAMMSPECHPLSQTLVMAQTGIKSSTLQSWVSTTGRKVNAHLRNGFIHFGKIVPLEEIPCRSAFSPNLNEVCARAGLKTLGDIKNMTLVTAMKFEELRSEEFYRALSGIKIGA